MAFDFEDICDAIGTAYATLGTATGAPVNMRAAFGQAPNAIPALPCCWVMPREGDVIYGSYERTDTHRIDLNFALSKSPGDMARIETLRQQWLPSLLTALEANPSLGIGAQTGWSVKSALVTGYEWALISFANESSTYDGIVIHIEVMIKQTVSMKP